MVVGVAVAVLALFVAQEFQRPVGDHLVGIHVGRRAGAALHHVDDELLLQFPGAQLLAGPDDRVGDRGVEQSQVAVGHRGALLDVGQGADQLRKEVEPHAADVEVLHRAHGLHAEIILRRDFHFAQQIVFTTGFARKSDLRKVHDRYVFIKGTQKSDGLNRTGCGPVNRSDIKYNAFSGTLLKQKILLTLYSFRGDHRIRRRTNAGPKNK